MQAVFSKREFWSNSVNISHAYIILTIDWEKLSEEESVFVKKKLGQDSVFGVIRSDEIEKFIAMDIISSKGGVEHNVE